jgi:ribonuclease-3
LKSMPSLDYKVIEHTLGVRFKRKTYLKRALTHSSYLQAQKRGFDTSNEILEFLGDAVLELIVREYLLHKYPHATEGTLSELKKVYTNTETLFKIGKRMGVGNFLLVNKGEERTGGRRRPSIVAACVEAIIGALYLDRGLPYTAKFVNRVLFSYKISKKEDYKSFVNKWSMQQHATICYKITKEKGPPHSKTFFVCLYVNNKKRGSGSGKTVKSAEQKAAKDFLSKIKTA